MTQYADPAFVPRATCYRCFRPESLCYCDVLQRVSNKTRVVVVQHPREQFHPLNTARIAEYSLRSSVVLRHRPEEMSQALRQARVSDEAAILFPSPDAEELETMPPELFPSEIIVVDGTWSHAKTLLRDVPELRRFRRLRFTPSLPSTYRIRKEPRADYLSTIESIAYVLRHVEPETEGLDHLLQSFSEMIDRNIAARRLDEQGPRFQRRKRLIPHRFPRELHAPAEHLVVAYCEGTSRFAKDCVSDSRSGENSKPFEKEPLVVYVKRPATGESLRVVLRTDRVPPARLLEHLALDLEELHGHGLSREMAAERLREWLSEDDVLVVWNASSHQILREVGVTTPTPLVLKGAFCDYMTYLDRRGPPEYSTPLRKWGGMDDFLERLDIAPQPRDRPGRGELRLLQTEALLSWIRLVAHADCAPDES